MSSPKRALPMADIIMWHTEEGMTCVDIARRLKKARGITVSSETVRVRLKEKGHYVPRARSQGRPSKVPMDQVVAYRRAGMSAERISEALEQSGVRVSAFWLRTCLVRAGEWDLPTSN